MQMCMSMSQSQPKVSRQFQGQTWSQTLFDVAMRPLTVPYLALKAISQQYQDNCFKRMSDG